MKRRDLLKALHELGARFIRRSGSHDIYANGIKVSAVPRHKEIDESLARKIIKDLSR